MAIQDYFCNTVTVIKRSEETVYEDWIAKKQYIEDTTEISCRVSSLSYQDLALISNIDDIQRTVRKLYTLPEIEIDPKDYVVWEGKNYQVIAEYRPQNKTAVHHNKYFIKLVE